MGGYNTELRNLKENEREEMKVSVTQAIEVKIGKNKTSITRKEAEALFYQLQVILGKEPSIYPVTYPTPWSPWEIIY